MLFQKKSFEVLDEVLHLLSYQDGAILVIEYFLGVRRCDVEILLHVKWRGFKDEECDWVP